MIRILLLTSLFSGIFLLWDRTSLPNVEPLSGEELASVMKDESAPEGASLREAFADIAYALADKKPIQEVFSPEEIALADAAPELRDYLADRGEDLGEATRLLQASIESLPAENWDDRERLLTFAQKVGEREIGFKDSAFISIGLRQLEAPTGEDVRDPAAIEVTRIAAELVAKRTLNPDKRAAILAQLLTLHQSEAIRAELEKAFQ